MGLQEHAGDMEQKPDEDLDAQNEEEQEPASEEEAAADAEKDEEQDEAKEEGPKTKIEQVVSDAVDKYGPQPPVEEMVELASVFGYIPGQPEYDEFMSAVQKFCGNDYGEALQGEFDKVTAEPAADAEEGADAKPPEEQGEADAVAEEPEAEAEGEEKAEDPAALEQEGPAAEEVPAALADSPAIQEEIAAKSDEEQDAAPAAEEVKEENAEVDAESSEDVENEEEVDAAPPGTDLRRGDQSPDVEELQNMLVGLGLMTQEDMDTGPGIFGPRTERALKAYQESLGLPATGFYGPQTRESLAQAAEPASPTEQIVLDLIASNGPQPDFGIMVAAITIVDVSLQPEFLTAVAAQCGDDYATQLATQLDAAASAAPAANSADAEGDQKSDQQTAQPDAEEAQAPDAQVVAAPEEQVETVAAPDELADAKAEVVDAAPEVVPDEAKEEVAEQEQKPQAADGEKDEEEEGAEGETQQAVVDAQEAQQEKGSDDVDAAPDAAPEEKQQAADEEKDQLAEAPEEAKVDESEATEESAEEQEAKKEQTENELAEQLAQEPAAADSMSALQALLEEADVMLAAGLAVLEDPVLDTTQATVAADAETMLSEWDSDLVAYAAELTALADRLTTPDLGSANGSQDVVASSQEKADALRSQAESLNGAAPAKVTVNAQLQDSSLLSFEAPISSRDNAVQEILQAFNDQMALHEGEKKGEDAPAAQDADPNAPA